MPKPELFRSRLPVALVAQVPRVFVSVIAAKRKGHDVVHNISRSNAPFLKAPFA